jgi:hypothetical protein
MSGIRLASSRRSNCWIIAIITITIITITIITITIITITIIIILIWSLMAATHSRIEFSGFGERPTGGLTEEYVRVDE